MVTSVKTGFGIGMMVCEDEIYGIGIWIVVVWYWEVVGGGERGWKISG